jgi:hypothetical protein
MQKKKKKKTHASHLFFIVLIQNPKKVESKLSWAFHDVWAIKLPWVKMVMGPNYSKMCVVRCQVYIFLKKKKEVHYTLV